MQQQRVKQKFIIDKLVAVLDRCELSVRNTVVAIKTVAEALGYNIHNIVINRS